MMSASPGSRSTSMARFICNVKWYVSGPPLPGAGAEPAIQMRPGGFGRPAPGHDSDMSARDPVQLLVLTADLVHDGSRLAGWRDVVALGNHGQQVSPDVAQIHHLIAHYEFISNQLVL